MKRIALLLVMLVGCTPGGGEMPPDGIPTKTVNFVTVQHDKHWWIYSVGQSLPFVHHPDCPCQKHRRPLLQADGEQPVN
jgi:hypothetical protein